MGVPQDTLDFISRWRAKERRYDYNKLADCFDGFFTAFVLYNLIYNLICARNETEYRWTKDSEKATEVAAKYLGAATIADDAEIKANALAIKGLIEKGDFYIREAFWDHARVANLGSSDPEQWSKAILEILYKIRCNTFHGEKPFQETQKEILTPCIKILRRLNEMLIEGLAPTRA